MNMSESFILIISGKIKTNQYAIRFKFNNNLPEIKFALALELSGRRTVMVLKVRNKRRADSTLPFAIYIFGPIDFYQQNK